MEGITLLPVLIVLNLILAATRVEGGITVFEDVDFQGESRRLLNFKACLDLTRGWEDKISSINTGGQCVILFEHKRCQGKFERIEPGTMRHNNLDSLNFNDRASSYKLC